MNIKQQAFYEARAKIFKALAHPTRLFILDELMKQERCVNELTQMVGADTSTVSKHLSILKNARVVQDEKRGAQVYYHIKMPCTVNFFHCVEDALQTDIRERMNSIIKD